MGIFGKHFLSNLLVGLVILLTGPPAVAKEPRYLQRSPRALFMGDAFTALADDEYTLFYNPAGLGPHKGFSMGIINPKAEVTNFLDDQDRFKHFPTKDPVAIADRVMGMPFHVEFGATPTVKMDQVGISLLADLNTNIAVYNKTHPVLSLDYRYDRGFIAGYAFNVGSAKPAFLKRGRSVGRSWLWSNGVGIKQINRQGIQKDFSLFSTSILTTIDSGVSNYSEFRDALGYSKGSGWGVDYGTLFNYHFNERTTVSAGASIMDIANTTFNRSEGSVPLPEQEMMVNTGLAFKQDYGLFSYSFSFDLHPVFQNMELARKTHIGGELSLPFVSVMGGFNGGYPSYGLGINIGLLKIYGGYYSIERGVDLGDKRENRMLLYLSLLDLSFDV